ncbi:hypothetical protein OXPF_39280 [Oxobacter pfennigii]|uniref:SGNH hydrolase-type esterase domain-containing protein n=1 Tax=Oxobacter pfennigii TaxID=36849 RepID=A0A0P8YRF2_9CLOT|nr:GDSL-type esterase/lipase family protein [Oxobacter pfennigii]KPU42149.1 hypothetical protein OXPF_39280 [Oxobacter pfennigii]
MPSANKTTFLNLNDWAASDTPVYSDFKSDNQKIDAKMQVHENTLEEHTTQLADTTAQLSLLDDVKADKTDVNSLATAKADITYVNTQVASVASGSPKGTYADVSALTAAIPAGDTNIYITLDNGNWNYWNGSAWTGGGIYQSSGLPDESIERIKLARGSVTDSAINSSNPGKNLFDKDKVTYGYYISYTTGLPVVEAPSFPSCYSDFIVVEPETAYSQNYNHQMAFYNAAKTFIVGYNTQNFTSPSGAYYARVSCRNDRINTNQFEKGTVSTDYESYGYSIEKLRVVNDNILEKNVSADKMSFVLPEVIVGKNLFDKSKAIHGYYVNYLNGKLVAENPMYPTSVSDYTKINESTQYVLSNTAQVAFYDKDLKYISGVNKGTNPFMSPSGAVWARYNMDADQINTQQLEVGDTATRYEPYQIRIKSLNRRTDFNPNTIVLLGDSITADNNDALTDHGFFSWANIFLGQRFKVVKYAGVPGETSTEIYDRIENDVLPYNPAYCMILAGANDLRQAELSAEEIIANLKLIYNTLSDSGINIITSTLVADSTLNAPEIQKRYEVNEWIRNYCQQENIFLVDLPRRITDPNTGLPLANTTRDGEIHFSAKGAFLAGKELANKIGGFIKPLDMFTFDNADPSILNDNPTMLGDNGGMATGYLKTGGSATASKVTRTDEIGGEWQQLVSEASDTTVSFTSDYITVSPGDILTAQVEVAINTVESLKKVELYLSYYNSSNVYQSLYRTMAHNDAYPNIDIGNWSGVLKTNASAVPEGVAKLKIKVDINFVGTARIGRVELRKVNSY